MHSVAEADNDASASVCSIQLSGKLSSAVSVVAEHFTRDLICEDDEITDLLLGKSVSR